MSEPEMFSFEWTKKMIGLDIYDSEQAQVLEAEWQARNREQAEFEQQLAIEYAREQARQPKHD